MLKPSSPVKPLLAAILVASGAHATASDSNSALLFNSALHSAKTDTINTIDSALQLDVKAITQSQHRRLERAWQLVIQQLHQTANSSRWGTIMYRAFGVDLTVAEALRQSWARNNFADLPAIEIADLSKVVMLSQNHLSSHNKRAIAAYSAANNRIYLSQQLLDNATAKQLAKVWLEEIGHSIDNRFNPVDTVGDEGAIFAKLITTDSSELPKQGIENLELQILQASNDHALLPVENQYKPVELATIEVSASCSLNNAITSANNDRATGGCSAGSATDTITFNASTDNTPITMTGQATISTDLTITGNGMSPTTVIQAASGNPHFTVDSSATIANLSLTGGNGNSSGGGSITVNRRYSLTLDRVEITNSTSDRGGAIYAINDSSLSINNSYLHNNTASNDGGAIYAESNSLSINNSHLHNNTADDGGAIFASDDSSLSINNSYLHHNTANLGYGGAIFARVGNTSINNSYLHNNTANLGGAIFSENSNTYISGTLIANNTAQYFGGGIYVNIDEDDLNLNFNMVNSTLYNNTAVGTGGNISLRAVSSYSHQTNNTNIVNSTISHGNASTNGGNMYVRAVHFANSQVALTVVNTIVANAVSGGDCTIENADRLTFTLINSLVEDGCENIDSQTNLLTGDPALGTLADNGGPLPTMALQSGSPAIDAGTTATSSITFSEVSFRFDLNGDGDATDTGLTIADLAYDARGTGFARVIGSDIDIGAFEFDPDNIPTPTFTVPLRWDIDGNGISEMADGSLVLRYLSGFRGEVLIADAIGTGASLTTAVDIEPVIQGLINDSTLDIDGNRKVNPVDGILLLRYLLGHRDEILINRAIGQGATRSSSTTIQAYIELPD